MEECLDLHNEIIRQQIREFGGYEVKTIGDCFMVSYADPISAVLFGVGVQEKFRRLSLLSTLESQRQEFLRL